MNGPTLADEVRAASRHHRGESIDALRKKIERIRTMEREAVLAHRVDAAARIAINGSLDFLQRAILRKLETTHTEWWW